MLMFCSRHTCRNLAAVKFDVVTECDTGKPSEDKSTGRVDVETFSYLMKHPRVEHPDQRMHMFFAL